MKAFREYIEQAEKKAHGTKALAEIIGQKPTAISDAKAGRRGLPHYALKRLQLLLGMDQAEYGDMIDAMELATEKDPAKRAFFAPFVLPVEASQIVAIARQATVSIGSKAAGLAICLLGMSGALISPSDVQACETSVVSPAAEGPVLARVSKDQNAGVQIMRNCM